MLERLKPEENFQAAGAALPWGPGVTTPVVVCPTPKPSGRKRPATQPATPGRTPTRAKRKATKPRAHRRRDR